MQVAYALSSGIFAVTALVALIVYGGDASRAWAIGAALLAAYSQFIAQDHRVWLLSILAAYAAAISAVVSFVCFVYGA